MSWQQQGQATTKHKGKTGYRQTRQARPALPARQASALWEGLCLAGKWMEMVEYRKDVAHEGAQRHAGMTSCCVRQRCVSHRFVGGPSWRCRPRCGRNRSAWQLDVALRSSGHSCPVLRAISTGHRWPSDPSISKHVEVALDVLRDYWIMKYYEYDCRKKLSKLHVQNSQMVALFILFILCSGLSLCRSGARLFRASTGGQRCPRVERSVWTLPSQIPSGKTEATRKRARGHVLCVENLWQRFDHRFCAALKLLTAPCDI